MGDSRLLQEPNLIASQPHRTSHHVKQATASEGLAESPYMAARLGFEPVTMQTSGTEPTTEPLLS